jgi:N-dimethylarginine dimethylaminohydrolase
MFSIAPDGVFLTNIAALHPDNNILIAMYSNERKSEYSCHVHQRSLSKKAKGVTLFHNDSSEGGEGKINS